MKKFVLALALLIPILLIGQTEEIKLIWEPVENALGYSLKVTDSDGDLIIAKRFRGNITSYVIEVKEGTEYVWSVIPYNRAGGATTVQQWTFKTVLEQVPGPTSPVFPKDGSEISIVPAEPTPDPTTGPWLTSIAEPVLQTDGTYNMDIFVHEFYSVGAISLSLMYPVEDISINSIDPDIQGMMTNDIPVGGKFRAGWFASTESQTITYPPVPMKIITVNFDLLATEGVVEFEWEHDDSACEYAGYGGTPIYFEAEFLNYTWTISN